MKAFWWFQENAIAGMARPGFNSTRWFDIPFEQAVLVGWIGQFASGSASFPALKKHVQEYGTKISMFYKMDPQSTSVAFERLCDRNGLLEIFNHLSSNTPLLKSYDVTDDQIHFEFNPQQLEWEIDFLKNQGIRKIVSLTEKHHSKDQLEEHFDAFHFSITDLDAPTLEQVEQLASIIQSAKAKDEKIAIHCLAGIGRTSTMLMTAHMVLGEKLDHLKTLIARQNPSFVFAGRQAAFIQSIAEKYGG